MNNQLRVLKNWVFIVVVLVGGMLYIGNSLINKEVNESAFLATKDIHIWSSSF